VVQEQLEPEDEIQVIDQDILNTQTTLDTEEQVEANPEPEWFAGAIDKYFDNKTTQMQKATWDHMQSISQKEIIQLRGEMTQLTEDAFQRKLDSMDEDEKVEYLLKERQTSRQRLQEEQVQQTVGSEPNDPNDPVVITRRILAKGGYNVEDDRLNWNAEFEGQSGEDYLVTMMQRAKDIGQTQQATPAQAPPQSNGHNPQKNAPPRMSSGASKVPQDFYELEELAVEKGAGSSEYAAYLVERKARGM
jgi:hypothetical protein